MFLYRISSNIKVIFFHIFRFFGMWMLFVVTRDHIKYYNVYHCYVYFILAVFVDSLEMSMIVVDDKSIFLNFIIQAHLTNYVSDIIYHGLLKYMACYFAFRQKIICQSWKHISGKFQSHCFTSKGNLKEIVFRVQFNSRGI